MAISLHLSDAAIIVLYLAVVITLGTIMKRRAARNLDSYFLGERQLPWWALAMSGSSSYFDITGTMWIVSLLFVMGLRGMWVQWIWGFTIPVFYMAYMGKWIRRSGVMTGSEWMVTRFGSGRAGELARATYTVFAVLTITAFLAYGAEGIGKFGSIYLPFSEPVCAALIIGISAVYVVVGGFHGVVVVEIFQTVVLSLGALLIAYLGFAHSSPTVISQNVSSVWWSLRPSWEPADLVGTEYAAFGALLIVWVVKGVLLELSGPEQLYDFQRFLAARDSRDACKLGALWGAVHTVRWPMAMAIAALALTGLRGVTDPEKVLPMVVGQMLPPGLRGVAIAALLSAFLATFASTVNGGASYLVRDIYQRYLRPQASTRELIRASYLSSASLVVLGLVIGSFAESINQMFVWIMGTLGAGVLLPNVLRWYWWRLNGWGYGVGALTGMLLSLVQALLPSLAKLSLWASWPAAQGALAAAAKAPLYVTFPVIAGTVMVITIVVSLRTPPTDPDVLRGFYRTVQPAGLWAPVDAAVRQDDSDFRKRSAFAGDFANVLIGTPWVACMYLFPMYLVLHQYRTAGFCLAVVAGLSVVLYFTWFRRLPAAGEATPASQDGAGRQEAKRRVTNVAGEENAP
ncbi:MAG: hypothetical protein ACE5R4_00685 [Armatimonadota bacterium]